MLVKLLASEICGKRVAVMFSFGDDSGRGLEISLCNNAMVPQPSLLCIALPTKLHLARLLLCFKPSTPHH